MWYPIHAINLNLLQVKGRSDYFLKLEVIKKILGVATLCITIPLGLVAMCYGRVFTSVVCLGLNSYYTNKLIGYGFVKQMKDLTHILIHSLVMFGLVFCVVNWVPTQWVQIVLGTTIGMTYYVIGAHFMKFEELKEVMSILKLKKV